MFKDSVKLIGIGDDVNLGVTDWSTPGRVTRNNGVMGLATAIQPSKENKGVPTKRLLVRVEVAGSAAIGAATLPTKPHVDVIFSKPEGTDDDLMLDLLARAVTFIVKGDTPSVTGLCASPETPTLVRLFAGEL